MIRRIAALILAFAMLIGGGAAFVYMIHAHSTGMGRWLFTSAAMLFLTGVMVAYDEIAGPPSITCPKCKRTSWHPKDIEYRYCGACGYHDGIGSK